MAREDDYCCMITRGKVDRLFEKLSEYTVLCSAADIPFTLSVLLKGVSR